MSNKTKRIKIKYKKERVILSDVLPYELPITFTNRYFYKFLLYYGIEIKNKTLEITNKLKLSKKDEKCLHIIIRLLFGLGFNEKFEIKNETEGSNTSVKKTIQLTQNVLARNPFTFRILHKENDFRELSIIHPKNQLDVIHFYDNYKELIIYYCNLSRFAIRKPDALAKFVYYKDKHHRLARGNEYEKIENSSQEYENLKTFFSYKKYNNIYKFYEDYHYQRAEKKYNYLVKFDIAQCFNSIYSHTISWAILGKNIVKDNINLSKNTFSGAFDQLMQNTNSRETNGILIGPEFSRIFAELILQKIDKNVEEELIVKKIFIGKDYECFRYVDDYFLFYNNEDIKNQITTSFKLNLREYKLSLNESKTITYARPIITDITMAKHKIVTLLEESIKFKIEEAEEEVSENNSDDTEALTIRDKYKMYINPNKLVAKFKSILRESNVEYKDILNYTFAIIIRKMEHIVNTFSEKFVTYTITNILDQKKKYNLENRFYVFIVNILDFIFFIYTASPRVNSTIKLTSILILIIDYLHNKQNNLSKITKDIIFKKIQDEIRLIIEKIKFCENAEVEILYLLIILKKLGKEYMISETTLANYFNMENDEKSGKYIINNTLNVLSITVLLSLISMNKEYDRIREGIVRYVVDVKIQKIAMNKRTENTELIILLFDILAYPYNDISNKYKKELLKLYGIVDEGQQNSIINFKPKQKFWFTNWNHINYSKELKAKIGLDVYS